MGSPRYEALRTGPESILTLPCPSGSVRLSGAESCGPTTGPTSRISDSSLPETGKRGVTPFPHRCQADLELPPPLSKVDAGIGPSRGDSKGACKNSEAPTRPQISRRAGPEPIHPNGVDTDKGMGRASQRCVRLLSDRAGRPEPCVIPTFSINPNRVRPVGEPWSG